MRRGWLAAVATAAIVVGCGGGTATQAPASTAASAAPSTTSAAATTAPEASASAAPVSTATAAAPSTAAPPASLAAGSIGYVVVNEWTGPVDVYLRSQGLVQASRAVADLQPGAATEQLFPPDPGEVVVLPAGSGDATCVSDCSFVAQSSTNFGEGDFRILLVRDASTELWANPSASSVGKTANALPPATPDRPLLIADAGGVSDAQFGLSLAWGGGKGCATPLNARGLLLGGTNILSYDMARTGGRVTVFLGSDSSCIAQAQGGPFRIPATAKGNRVLLLLHGKMGAMSATTLDLP